MPALHVKASEHLGLKHPCSSLARCQMGAAQTCLLTAQAASTHAQKAGSNKSKVKLFALRR